MPIIPGLLTALLFTGIPGAWAAPSFSAPANSASSINGTSITPATVTVTGGSVTEGGVVYSTTSGQICTDSALSYRPTGSGGPYLILSSGTLQIGSPFASTVSANGFMTLANLPTTSAPSPAAGRMYYDSTLGQAMISPAGGAYVPVTTGSYSNTGGSASPGGSANNIQYSTNGAIGGLADFNVWPSSVALGGPQGGNHYLAVSTSLLVGGSNLGVTPYLVVIGTGANVRAPNSGGGPAQYPLWLHCNGACRGMITDWGDGSEAYWGVDSSAAFYGTNVSNIATEIRSGTDASRMRAGGVSGGLRIHNASHTDPSASLHVVSSATTQGTILLLQNSTQNNVFSVTTSSIVWVSSGTVFKQGDANTILFSSAPIGHISGNTAVGALASGTTFLTFVPDAAITLLRLNIDVVVAGIGGTGDRLTCNDAGTSGFITTSLSAAATAGTTATASARVPINYQAQVYCHIDSDATTRPIVNVVLEYVSQ